MTPISVSSFGKLPFDYDPVFKPLSNTRKTDHAGPMFFNNHGTPQDWHFTSGYRPHI